jgi:hypothetical protein
VSPAGADLTVDLMDQDTTAQLTLRLAPDWPRPETWLGALARYLAHAPADGSTCLCLDVAGAAAGLASELVAVACETLAPSRATADVLLCHGGDGHRPASRRVRSGADVLAALGVRAPALSDDAQVVRRARRSKLLADELQAIADHHVMTLGGDPWRDPEPLVSVPLPTWRSHGRLAARAIPSILDGTYRKVEVLVCSDGPDPEARAAVGALAAHDPRVRYLELPARPDHPSHPRSFWETCGLHAANHALDAARGRFVAPLEHDGEFTATHIADLLAHARAERADLVHGQALCRQRSGPPQLVGRPPLAREHVRHGAVLYSDRLAHMRYDTACWLLEEPGDWNMWRRMEELGAGVAFLDRVVLLDGPDRAPIAARTAADVAPDVLGTGAAWYLDVEFAGSEVAA